MDGGDQAAKFNMISQMQEPRDKRQSIRLENALQLSLASSGRTPRCRPGTLHASASSSRTRRRLRSTASRASSERLLTSAWPRCSRPARASAAASATCSSCAAALHPPRPRLRLRGARLALPEADLPGWEREVR
jgi:hypothetical protein